MRMLRLGGFSLMAGYGVLGDGGARVVVGGLFDLIVGAIYLVGLPRHLRVSLADLLLDRQAS